MTTDGTRASLDTWLQQAEELLQSYAPEPDDEPEVEDGDVA